ncbi:hypothetical protein P3T35_005482 [Kitasatospora sp. GP30]|nr:hypothetical protein [Kitasatospora sp. GP30]
MRSTLGPAVDLAGLTDATALTGLGAEQVQSGQELVFIGTGLRKGELRAALTHCLLDDAEHAAGPHAWMAFEDHPPAFGREVPPTAWDEYELLQDHDHSHA